MADIKYVFTSDALDEAYFTVVAFEGVEGLSRLYEYTIELKASTLQEPPETFLEDVLDSEPCFKMIYKDVEHPVYGMLSEFTENQTSGGQTYYTAVLVPRIWSLTLNRDSRVFLDQNVWDIVETMLSDYQLDFQNGDLDVGVLLDKEYRCQFNESDFAYISRLLENEGIYYYFDQAEGIDTIVLSNADAGEDAVSDALVYENNPSSNKIYDSVSSWVCRKKRLPQKVLIENYNPETPSDEFISEFDVSNSETGEQYFYGDNVDDADDAVYIAEIRAQEIAANQTKYYAESGVCALHAGLSFSLENHDNDFFNCVSSYVITEIHHQGQFLDGSMSGGDPSGNSIRGRMSQERPDSTQKPQYLNSFTAIESDIQYRPARRTHVPKFHGTISAFVYAESDVDYAEIDEHGLYRVTLPFKRADREDSERASHWIRMARPYAGQFIDENNNVVNEGMSYPLMANTEVLLTFVNGDPDRPIISSAIANTLRPELVTSENNHQTAFNTHGMYATDIRGGISSFIWCKEHEVSQDLIDEDIFYQQSNVYKYNFSRLNSDASSTGEGLLNGDTEYSGKDVVTERYGDEYIFIDGNTYKWDNEKAFCFGNDYEEIHEDEDGITNGEVFDMEKPMQSIGTHPTGGDYSEWADGADGLTEKNWGDKCEYHYGRSFCWSAGKGLGEGGAQETYNYGNGYTENLLTTPESGIQGGTSDTWGAGYSDHSDKWDNSDGWRPSPHDNMAKSLAPIGIGISVLMPGGAIAGAIRGGIMAGVDALVETGTDLAEANGLNPGSTAAEKTFGHTYSYHMGFAVDVHDGNSVSRTYGDSDDFTSGNAESVTQGDSVSTTYGVTSEAYLGSKYEFNLATSDSMTVGLSNELKLSSDTTVHIGFESSCQLAGLMKFCLGAGMDITKGPIIEGNEAEVKASKAAIADIKADIVKNAAQIEKTEVKLGKVNAHLSKVTAKLIQGDVIVLS